MGLFGRKEPLANEAFALEEQARAEGMLRYAAEHASGITPGLWQEAQRNAAVNTAQPKGRPKRGRRG